ncbi:Calcium/calmodulin-dependent 3' 5'-cyclic nucleotide phosphodiesterase 1C [Bienertia sinuspersici]
MQSSASPTHHHQGHPPYNFAPPPCYPPPNCGYPPYYSWGYPTPYNAFPGSVFNSGGNRNESGTQENGDVKVGNRKDKTGGIDIDKIGGNHGNTNGQQVAGHVSLGNITSA